MNLCFGRLNATINISALYFFVPLPNAIKFSTPGHGGIIRMETEWSNFTSIEPSTEGSIEPSIQKVLEKKKLAKFYQTFGPFSIELLWLSIEPSVEGYIEPSAEGSIEPSTRREGSIESHRELNRKWSESL